MSINKVNVWKRFDLTLYDFDSAHYHGNADPAGINKPQCLDLNQVYPWDGSKGSTTLEFFS
jgi:hypothetical protein